MNQKLKPFNLEAAKAGAKVMTRDGRAVRIICTDAEEKFPVIGIIDGKPCTYGALGDYHAHGETRLDLLMAPVTITKWINIYPGDNSGYIYDSKEDADRAVASAHRIACVKVEYEV